MFLDVTIVNIAFPDVVATYPGVSLADLSWVVDARLSDAPGVLLLGGAVRAARPTPAPMDPALEEIR